MRPCISVITPVRDDTRVLRMFESFELDMSDEVEFEFILVLNYPTKEVLDVADRIRSSCPAPSSVRIVRSDVSNLGHLYNVGLLAASNDDCMFIDSDMTCAPGAPARLVRDHMTTQTVTKARLQYIDCPRWVADARSVNTGEEVPPYIPVIVVNKDVFTRLAGDFVFAVDVVWCSDAEFANRVLRAGIPIVQSPAQFYHGRITVKKDLYDAMLYGRGKGIRLTRTGEPLSPLSELVDMWRRLRRLSSPGSRLYGMMWLLIQQVSCSVQMHRNTPFSASLPFEKSLATQELIKSMRNGTGVE